MGFLSGFQKKDEESGSESSKQPRLQEETNKSKNSLDDKSRSSKDKSIKSVMDDSAPNTLPEIPKFETSEALDPQNIPHFPEVTPEYATHIINETHFLEQLPVINTEDSVFTNFKYADLKKPLFIRTDQYSKILLNLDTLKEYVRQSSEIIYSLENLKRNADIEHNSYKNSLEDIQRKLIYVDKVIFES